MTDHTAPQKDSEINSPLAMPEVEASLQGWCSQLASIDEGEIFTRKSCAFCTHRLRLDAEQKWEESRNAAMVKRFFEKNVQEGDPVVSYMTIRTHLTGHYTRQIRNLQVKEYSEHLLEMLNYKITKDQQLEALSTSLQMKYMEIAANGEIDEIKAADMQIKLAKMMLDIICVQEKLRGELSSASVVAEKFINSWVKLLTKEKDPQRRLQLAEQLQQFREEISGLEDD